MPPKQTHPIPFTNPLHPPTPVAAQAAYATVEQQHESSPPSPTPPERKSSLSFNPSPNSNPTLDPVPSSTDLTPHQISIKRTKSAKARLATAHEGWTLVARALVKSGVVPSDQDLTKEMKEFGDVIQGRYAAANFLWNVLLDMPGEDWFGKGEKFDATLRRLRTLKGLEGSLVCWEGVVLRLVEVVDCEGGTDGNGEGGEGGKGKGIDVEEVKRVLGRWRRGVPSRP